jgi:hypothetical protein
MQLKTKAMSDFEAQIERMKKENNGVISQIREEHTQKEKATKAAHDNEIAMLRASLGQNTSDEINRLKMQYAEEMKLIEQKHEKLIGTLNQNFDKQLAQKEQDHADTIGHLDKAHEEAIAKE